ncbi:NAD(P)-dependent oxidoreductase [Pokkaliibacter plantistimulans]|nr:NAD(P)-dependent oxidoreductase [Pokkaliibacter plantistimulans]
MMNSAFNSFDIKGCACLVMGGAEAADRAVRALLALGGNVSVCAPVLAESMQLLARDGGIHWIHKGQPEEVLSRPWQIVSIATDDAELDTLLLGWARERGLPVFHASSVSAEAASIPVLSSAARHLATTEVCATAEVLATTEVVADQPVAATLSQDGADLTINDTVSHVDECTADPVSDEVGAGAQPLHMPESNGKATTEEATEPAHPVLIVWHLPADADMQALPQRYAAHCADYPVLHENSAALVPEAARSNEVSLDALPAHAQWQQWEQQGGVLLWVACYTKRQEAANQLQVLQKLQKTQNFELRYYRAAELQHQQMAPAAVKAPSKPNRGRRTSRKSARKPQKSA